MITARCFAMMNRSDRSVYLADSALAGRGVASAAGTMNQTKKPTCKSGLFLMPNDGTSLRRCFQPGIEDFDIDLSAGDGGSCFRESHLSLKQFFLQSREFVGWIIRARQSGCWDFSGSIVHDAFPAMPVIDGFFDRVE